MRPTKTVMGKKAQEYILKGVNAVYEPVRRTFGPYGKNALLYRGYNRGSRITNDGVTVGGVQEPKNAFIKLVAETFNETCRKTNEKQGDGTTATTIIAGKLVNDVISSIGEGQSSFITNKTGSVSEIRNKILATAKIVKEEIKKSSKKIETLEDLEKIAIVSVENEELGKKIASVAYGVGIDGFIDVVEGYKGKIEIEETTGMRFPAKVAAKVFINKPERYEMVAEDSHIVITNYKLDNPTQLGIPLSEIRKTNGISKIIVVAPSFSENVLIDMVNASKAGFTIYPVSAPSLRTEQMEDLAVYCNGTVIDKNKGRLLKNIKFEDLGFLEKLIVKDSEAKDEAVATGGRGLIEEKQITYEKIKGEDGKTKNAMKEVSISDVQQRINDLKGQLEETKQENFKKLMQRRIASMASAGGVIRVGDSTQASSLYIKLKVEDAVYACKSALRGGYVKGGGLCLKEIADKLPDDDILKPALLEPYNQIQNSIDGGVKINDDIIDPADVIHDAVEHATSVAAQLITVDIITPEVDDVQPGDGYMAIAKALLGIEMAFRRQHGLIKENEEEQAKDRKMQYMMGELEAEELIEGNAHSEY